MRSQRERSATKLVAARGPLPVRSAKLRARLVVHSSKAWTTRRGGTGADVAISKAARRSVYWPTVAVRGWRFIHATPSRAKGATQVREKDHGRRLSRMAPFPRREMARRLHSSGTPRLLKQKEASTSVPGKGSCPAGRHNLSPQGVASPARGSVAGRG